MLTIYADHAAQDYARIPVAEVRELFVQMNCNLYCSEDDELYFVEPEEFEGLTIMTSEQFFETFIQEA